MAVVCVNDAGRDLRSEIFAYCREQCPEISVEKIALRLGRICRFAGGTEPFWPVLTHSLVVAGIVPAELRIHALLHDAGEFFTGDIVSPIKDEKNFAIDDHCMEYIYGQLGIPLPSVRDWFLVKQADKDVCAAEIWTVGPVALRAHRDVLAMGRNYHSERMINRMLDHYTVSDVLCPDGAYVRMFSDQVMAGIIRPSG